MGQALIGAALNICLDAWQETELRKIKGRFLVLYEQTFESTQDKMATKDIHDELLKWKDVSNLIELKKHQYSNLFPYIYWIMGIIFVVLNLFVVQAKETIINVIGIWPWIFIILALTLSFIWMLLKIAGSHKTAINNLDYLYRKKDGQKV